MPEEPTPQGPHDPAPPSLAEVSLKCRCPRCGVGPLFTRLLVLREQCPECGLDLTKMDVGDAFAVPLLIVVGGIVVGLAFWLEFRFNPPLWVHAVIWPVVTLALTVLLMRPSKSFLIAQEYRTRIQD